MSAFSDEKEAIVHESSPRWTVEGILFYLPHFIYGTILVGVILWIIFDLKRVLSILDSLLQWVRKLPYEMFIFLFLLIAFDSSLPGSPGYLFTCLDMQHFYGPNLAVCSYIIARLLKLDRKSLWYDFNI